MTRSNKRAAATAAAALACCVLAGVAVAAAAAPDAQAPPASSEPGSTESGPTTSGVPAFADGEDARLAAEELIPAYIESEFGVTVTDPACSVPERGAVGDRFVCYALKPDDLVIALRATVGERRLVQLQLLFDQPPAPPPTEAPATTAG